LRRATRRGVRKCPQCGTINGTRGISCKNRQCDKLFETAVAKRGLQAATRLVVAVDDSNNRGALTIGPEDQVFSVRLKSRANPEHRGFVKLRRPPQGQSQPQTECAPLCISCNLPDCVHVAASADSAGRESVPCSVRQSVLNSMSISGDWKHKIWLTARDYGPLAQRVSKTTMVVKCETDQRHKLGYLHTTFVLSEGSAGQQKFRCDCLEAAEYSTMQLSNSTTAHRCIHFYSCMAVFLSDPKLAKEFDAFIQDDQIVTGMLTSLNQHKSAGSVKSAAAGQESVNIKVAIQELATIHPSNLDESTSEQSDNALFAAVELPDKVSLLSCTVNKQTVVWLASLTEMINASYGYPDSGDKQQQLTLMVDHHTFDDFKVRFSSSTSQLLLPNCTQAYVRKSDPPYGTFSRHVWRLTCLRDVKRLFDTEVLQLQLALPAPDHLTCLAVGPATPFTLHWTPGILPICQKGELQVTYWLTRTSTDSSQLRTNSTVYLQHHDYVNK